VGGWGRGASDFLMEYRKSVISHFYHEGKYS